MPFDPDDFPAIAVLGRIGRGIRRVFEALGPDFGLAAAAVWGVALGLIYLAMQMLLALLYGIY